MVIDVSWIPFIISPACDDLRDIYPSSEVLRKVYIETSDIERFGIIRLWMTEGIPYAFKENPLIYEEIRNFIAKGVNVESKEVSIIGSARIGYSLSKKEWGRPFNENSDFDFAIVSNRLYAEIVQDFQKWITELKNGNVLPKNHKEMEFWLINIEQLDKQIPKGFIQTNMIPYHIKLPVVKKCYDAIWLLKKRLGKTNTAPKVADASIRVYSSWNACIRQMHINFKSALDVKKKKIS
jgi:hypothetical protein